MIRKLSWVSLVLVAAACGRGFDESGRERGRTPLTSCEGLDRAACGARADCVGEELACIALCVDDGHGGCGSPCGDTFRCTARPLTPSPCEGLDVTTCGTRSDCTLERAVCTAECADDGHGGCLPSACDAARCVTRQPAGCADRDAATCESDPSCELVAYACPAVCLDDGHGGCLPCNAPPPVCQDRHVACTELDANACLARPDCAIAACPADCGPTADCRCDTSTICVPAPTPTSCDGLDANICDATPGCAFVIGACPPNADCSNAGICVSTGPTGCAAHDATSCVADSRCELVTAVCDAACHDDGHGGCLPCAPTSFCVERQPASPCDGLDSATCEANPACDYVTRECPPNALCAPDYGVCVPAVTPTPSPCEGLDPTTCEANPVCDFVFADCPPNAICAPDYGQCMPATSPCFALDVAACTTDPRCEVVAYACTAVCIDDGQGGCLPCDVPPPSCQPRPEEPVVGCGSGGSQPPGP